MVPMMQERFKVKPMPFFISLPFFEWALSDSNRRPIDYESIALTAELRAQTEMQRVGLEPTTNGLKVRCSTN